MNELDFYLDMQYQFIENDRIKFAMKLNKRLVSRIRELADSDSYSPRIRRTVWQTYNRNLSLLKRKIATAKRYLSAVRDTRIVFP